jgi:hypothetical protein
MRISDIAAKRASSALAWLMANIVRNTRLVGWHPRAFPNRDRKANFSSELMIALQPKP